MPATSQKDRLTDEELAEVITLRGRINLCPECGNAVLDGWGFSRDWPNGKVLDGSYPRHLAVLEQLAEAITRDRCKWGSGCNRPSST